MSLPAGSNRDPDLIATELVEQYQTRLRVFALRRLRNLSAAEDATQETLHRVLVALREQRVKDLQALPAYVFEILRHVCAHHLRGEARSERAHAALSDVAGEAVPDPLTALVSAERTRQVREALESLEPEDRTLMRLTYVEGQTAEAIAAHLGLSASNVRIRRYRLKRVLAKRMGVTDPPLRAPEREPND